MDISSFPKFSIRGTISDSPGFENETTTSAQDVRKFLEENADAKTVVFEIASYGGFVSEGFEMYDLMKNSGKKIITIGYRVNSIAVMPFLAGSKRYVTENCDFVIHNSRINPMHLGLEPLTAEDLELMMQDMVRTDKKILDAYCDVLGEEKRSKLFAEMAAESNLGSKGAIKLGFANGIWKAKEKAENFSLPPLCLSEFWNDKREILHSIQNQYMEHAQVKALENKMSLIEKAINFLKSKFVKNEVTLSLAGDAGSLWVDAADGEDIKGKPVFLLVDGVPGEPAPDGDHPLTDGRTIVVAAGVITDVKDGEATASLKEEIANLKKQLEEKDKLVADAATENKTLKDSLENFKKESQSAITDIQNQFEEFKKMVPGDGDDKSKDEAERRRLELENKTKKINPEVARIYAAQANRFKKQV